MQLIVDLLWDAFNHGTVTSGSPQRPRAISWVGFYAPDPADPQAMILAARRDKPACSPIGLHGACGQSHRERLALVIPDIATLGAGYIACDPRDRAELVVPLLQADGSSLGVLDFDSYDTNAFTHDDALGAIHLLRTVGLFTWPGDAASIIQQR
jgi:putative methionine-R-sulfoxide reductase with GAF domain